MCAGFLVVGVVQAIVSWSPGLHGSAAVVVVWAIVTVVCFLLARYALIGWAGGLVRYGRWWKALRRGAAAVPPQQLVGSAD